MNYIGGNTMGLFDTLKRQAEQAACKNQGRDQRQAQAVFQQQRHVDNCQQRLGQGIADGNGGLAMAALSVISDVGNNGKLVGQGDFIIAAEKSIAEQFADKVVLKVL